ncbi:MAG: tetratricopeptide repeat protein [Myxococcales bacterium]|nr:tetratricopeptide repeat protein [Myxococcales bacterium]
MGREVLRYARLPAEEPFLFPFTGVQLNAAPAWLGSVVIYLSHLALGEAGPVYLAGLVTALLFTLLFLDSHPRPLTPASLLASLLPLALALTLFRGRAVARPELFANLLLAATLFALRRHEDGHSRTLLLFPLAAALWINLHPSLLTGLAVIGIYLASGTALLLVRRLTSRSLPGTPSLRQLALATALALAALLAAGLLNPAGFEPLLVSLRFASTSAATAGSGAADGFQLLRHAVAETRPPPLSAWTGALGALTALTAASFALAFRQAKLRELLTAALFLFLGARMLRFAPMAAVVMAPIAARNLSAFLARLPIRIGKLSTQLACSLALAPLVAFAAWHAAHIPGVRFGTQLRLSHFPVRAAQYLHQLDFHGRLFNTFHLGGYLEWTLDRLVVFQDGRGLLHQDDMEAATGGADPSKLARLDAKYHFDALVLAYPGSAALTPGAEAALGKDDWLADRSLFSLVAFDDGGLLYLRRDGPYATQAARDEYRALLPGNPFAPKQATPDELARLMPELERSLIESPRCSRCRMMLGFVQLAQGDAAAAEASFLPTLGLSPWSDYLAELGLGEAASLQGKPASARAHYLRALAHNPASSDARRALAKLFLDEGQLEEAARLLRENLESQPASLPDLSLLAEVERKRGDEAAANEVRRRTKEANRLAQAEAYFLQGASHVQAGRLPEAVAAYRASLLLAEQSAPAHSNLGYLHYDLGELDSAIAEQRRALEIDPRHAEAHYGLALALMDRGDGPGAIAAFREYLKLRPRGHWSQKAEEHLRRLEGR